MSTQQHRVTGSARLEQRSTRIAFFIAGFGMAAWAPLVPFVKARAGLDDGVLGVLLLCLGAGSMVAMPIAGAFSARFGCRVVIVASTVVLSLVLPLLATAACLPMLVGALLLFGASVGSIDVSMNIQAILVERASGRSMMSGFHGLFSLGGIAGAGGVTMLLSLGASPLAAISAVVAVIAGALLAAAPYLLPYGSRKEGPAFAVPRGIVLFIGVLCFIVFLTEGAMLDWSAVFMTTVHGVEPSYAGLGYAAFAVTMTAGRLTGDRIVSRFGGVRVVVLGSFCAAAGVALATLAPNLPSALVGFALIGVGCSNIVPVLFTSVGRQTTMPESVAVPAITTVGYAGILLGPAGIGFLAEATTLAAAFLSLAVLLIAAGASGRLLRI